MYNYYSNPQMQWMAARFRNLPDFLEKLKDAIVDERTAILFYTELYEIAPTETAKYAVKTALDDEKVHNKRLTHLYMKLTGHKPDIEIKRVEYHHFYEGLKIAFLDEVKAYEGYKEMYLSTNCPTIRDLLYSIQHDEMEHATLFNWVHTELK